MSTTPDPEASVIVPDLLALEPWNALVSIDTYTIFDAEEVGSSDDLTILMKPRPWTYALWFPLTEEADAPSQRIVVRVTGWVNTGRVAVGLAATDRTAFVDEKVRTPEDGLTCFDLYADSSSACWAVVVRNAATDGTASAITIDSVKAYRRLREPAKTPTSVHWIENRQASPAPPELSKTERGHTGSSGTPAISLVLTIRNGMPYLPQAIESVRRQEFRDYELIVQDCCSTDGTLDYLDTVRDLPISIVSEQDDGIGDAWQRAFARCRGGIVGSIDADNLLKPDALSAAHALFEEFPWAAAFYGSIDLIDDTGQAVSSFVPSAFEPLRLMSCQLVPPWSTAFFSRRICGDDLVFDSSIRVCTDFDVWLRLSHLPILHASQVLGSTRLSPSSMTCRVETYDSFCRAKIQALENYVKRRKQEPLNVGLIRYGIAGIYCWAAESTQRLGANREEVGKFVGLALRADPDSDRARRIQSSR